MAEDTDTTKPQPNGPTDAEREALKRILGVLSDDAERKQDAERQLIFMGLRKAEFEMRAAEVNLRILQTQLDREKYECDLARINRDIAQSALTRQRTGTN